jgi:hypothetical protein
MTPGPITNEHLNRLLLTLGFEKSSGTKDRHCAWRHPETGATFILPVNKADEEPLEANLLTVRKGLDRNGHLESAEFDEFARTGKLPEIPKLSS